MWRKHALLSFPLGDHSIDGCKLFPLSLCATARSRIDFILVVASHVSLHLTSLLLQRCCLPADAAAMICRAQTDVLGGDGLLP